MVCTKCLACINNINNDNIDNYYFWTLSRARYYSKNLTLNNDSFNHHNNPKSWVHL